MNMPLTGQALEALKANDPFLRGALPALKRDPSDASIGTGNFTQGVPAYWFARSLEYGSAENLYNPFADSAWVRSAIKKISQPIASCQVLFSKPTTVTVRQKRARLKQLSTARGIVYRAEEELLDLPQLSQWLKEPVADLTYQDFVEASVGWLKMQECFWVIPDNARKVPFPEVSLNPYAQILIPQPDRMRPTIEDGEITEWILTKAGGKTLKLDLSQVVRLRGWNPYDEHRGLGDYRAVHIAAEADWLAGKFARNLMANNGDTSRIISVKGGQPTDDQRKQLIMEFKARREASLRGQSRDVVVGGDVELHNAELASIDPSFVAQRIEHRHEIYNGMDVPMSMADIKASYSIGSASDMFQLLINACIPTGGKMCGALEKLIFKLTGERIEVGLNWDEHPCMQEVRKERLDSIAKLAAQGMPMEQINEYLALGLVQYPGWEVGYLPINVAPVLNEAGEVNPAPTPGDFKEGGEPGPINDGGDTPKDGDAPEVKAMLHALRARVVTKGSAKNEQNEQIWKAHMKLRSAAIKQYQGKVGKLFMAYRAKALKKMEALKVYVATDHSVKRVEMDGQVVQTKSLVDVIFDPSQFARELLTSLDPVTHAVLQRAGEELMDEIGRGDDPWKMAPMQAKHFISLREKLLHKVGETAQAQLNTALATGMDNGETMDQLTDRVRGVFNNLTNYEAKRIAMTETSAAYGFSRQKAMTDAGIEYKAWLRTYSEHPRDSHIIAEDTYGTEGDPGPIPIDQPFVVAGEELMYPGDQDGSPENVINCHCVQIAVMKPEGETE